MRHLSYFRLLFHSFLKPEHPIEAIITIVSVLFTGLRIMRVRVVTIVKLYDVKTAAVDIKVYITFLKVRRHSLPHGHFGMQLLNSAPRGLADAFAVHFR